MVVRWNTGMQTRFDALKPTHTYAQIAEALNEEFKTTLSERQVAYQGRKTGGTTRKAPAWTPPRVALLQELKMSHGSEEIAAILNERFGTDFTTRAIRARSGRLEMKKIRKHAWSDAMVARLSELKPTLTNRQIAEKLNEELGTALTTEAVKVQSRKKDVGQKNPGWTDPMVRKLLELKNTHDDAQIADEITAQFGMPRNANAVKQKRRRLEKAALDLKEEQRVQDEKKALIDGIMQVEAGTKTPGRRAGTDSERMRLLQGLQMERADMDQYARFLKGDQGKKYAELYGRSLDGENAWTVAAHAVVKKVMAKVGPEDEVLDLGSGPGTLLYAFKSQRRAPPKVTHVDLNPHQIALGRALHPEAEFLTGDVTELPEKFHGRFDWATMMFMLKHLDEPNRLKALSNAHRALKLGGRLLISNPDAAGFSDAFRHGLNQIGFQVEQKPTFQYRGSKTYRIPMLVLRKATREPGTCPPLFLRFPEPREWLEGLGIDELKKRLARAGGNRQGSAPSEKTPGRIRPERMVFSESVSKKAEPTQKGPREKPDVHIHWQAQSEYENLRRRAIEYLRAEGYHLHFLPFEEPPPRHLDYHQTEVLVRQAMDALKFKESQKP